MSSENNDDDALQMLLAMGFAASSARAALARNGGNVEHAANDLLTTGNDEPPTSGDVSSNNDNVVHMIQGTTSQYSHDHGRSACTCIALQGARQFLTAIRTKDPNANSIVIDAAFLDQMVQEGCRIYAEEWRSSQQQSSSSSVEHASVEDVLHLFPNLTLDGVRQGLLSQEEGGLYSILLECQSPTDWICLIMIKPPETVLLCLPPNTGGSTQQQQHFYYYYLVDSHPRRSEFGTEYAYVRRHASLTELVSASIRYIFPSVTDLGPDVPEYMTAMYNSFDVYAIRRSQL